MSFMWGKTESITCTSEMQRDEKIEQLFNQKWLQINEETVCGKCGKLNIYTMTLELQNLGKFCIKNET
jgi:hypothetical protein